MDNKGKNELLTIIRKALEKSIGIDEVNEFISQINKVIDEKGYSWVKVFAAEVLDEVYGGLNEFSARYYFLFVQDIVKILEGLIVAWFEDRTGFFREKINPILLAETIERLMVSIKGLESDETYVMLGDVFRKIIEGLDRRRYGSVWRDLWRKAENCYLRALSLNRENFKALEGLGDLYFMKEDFQKALNYYTQATILNKENARLWAKIGLLFDKMSDVDKALEAYEESFKIERRVDVAKRLRELYLAKGLKEKARELEEYLESGK